MAMPKAGVAGNAAVAATTGGPISRLDPNGEGLITETARGGGQRGIIAIDPGDVHIGIASGVGLAPYVDGKPVEGADDELRGAWEMAYVPALHVLSNAIRAGWVEYVVIEDWTLYKDQLPTLVGSHCETARFIGAVEWMVRAHNRWAATVEDRAGIELYEQPAHLQEPTKSFLREFGIERTSRPGNPHALSAELHWWYFLLQRRGLLGPTARSYPADLA